MNVADYTKLIVSLAQTAPDIAKDVEYLAHLIVSGEKPDVDTLNSIRARLATNEAELDSK